MFTATDGIVLPTTVIGSWPRPRWFDVGMWGEQLSLRMTDNEYREKFLDATQAVVNEQQRAGLDILTNGDYHLDDNLGGLSWLLWNVERMGGVEAKKPIQSSSDWAYPAGHILNEVMGGWRYPPVTGQLHEDTPLEFDKLWRLAQLNADRPVKFGTATAQIVASFLENRSDFYDDDKRQLTWDLAGLMNTEFKRLAAAGCKVIQLEDPMIHLAAASNPPAEYVDFLVDALNHEIEGLDDVEVWVHTCWGNPNMQRVADEATNTYASSLETYLYRLNCDVLTVEMKERNFRDIELFGNFRDHAKKISVGVISHRDIQVESAEEVAADTRTALQHIDADRLVLGTDCGFGRGGFNRLVAYHKAAAMAAGANIVRRELGAPTTSPRSLDPGRQIDTMPQGEEVGAFSQSHQLQV